MTQGTNHEPLWWVLETTQSGLELKVRDAIRDLGHEPFWPYYSEWVATGQRDRTRLIKKSLYPRYLFAKVPSGKLWELMEIREIRHVLPRGLFPQPVVEGEMAPLLAMACPNGEVVMNKEGRKRLQQQFLAGDLIKLKDVSSPFCGLTVSLTSVSDNGIMGEICGDSSVKVSLTAPIKADLVERKGP